MTEDKIKDMVDNSISKSITDGKDFNAIIRELNIKIDNFKKIISKSKTYEEISMLKYDEIPDIRNRYGVTYIRQCYKRLGDLLWVIQNKERFNKLDDKKLFNLMRFRDRFIAE